MKNRRWKKLVSKVIIETPFIKILKKDFRRSDGTIARDYYLLEKPPSVHIVAINSEGKIILVRHYRPGLDEVSLELPAGSIKSDEKPKAACQRELFEETGYKAGDMRKIFNFTQDTSRFAGCRCHFFLARDLKKIKNTEVNGKDGEIEVIEVSFPEAVRMIKGGQIKDLPTIAGILFAAHQKKEVYFDY